MQLLTIGCSTTTFLSPILERRDNEFLLMIGASQINHLILCICKNNMLLLFHIQKGCSFHLLFCCFFQSSISNSFEVCSAKLFIMSKIFHFIVRLVYLICFGKELSTMICQGESKLHFTAPEVILYKTNLLIQILFYYSPQVCMLCWLYALQWKVWRK